ncbi:tRNA1(Val) (adenine(37)-N6)-methyltransferase [Roseospira visakhapatnamensis]|nr:methyltransferase domain-containing protein [Roseospira visakhapatnamensis]
MHAGEGTGTGDIDIGDQALKSRAPDDGAGDGGGDAAVEETGLLGGRVRLLQPRVGYRVAMDPVLLAAAAPFYGPGPVRRVLDAGLGTGAAALCLLARAAAVAETVPDLTVTGIERSPAVAALAGRSAALNGWTDRLRVVVGDVTDPPGPDHAEVFDLVMTNPPYGEAGRGTRPPVAARAAAHVESVPLTAWVDGCLARLRPKGRLVIIHRADRLDDLLAALRGRAGALELIPLWPGSVARGSAGGGAARRVIVRARKGIRGRVRLLPGLALHEADGSHGAQAERVLRDGVSLDTVLSLFGPDERRAIG